MPGPGVKVPYVFMDDKTVTPTRSGDQVDHDDRIVAEFLDFLAADMQANPSNVQPVTQDLLTRARHHTNGVTVDLDAPLDPRNE